MATKNYSYTIDAAGKTIGRIASEAAKMLMGKTTADYTPNIRSDVNAQAIKIRTITNAHVLNFVVCATDWAKDCVKRNRADFYALFLVLFFWNIAKSSFCTQLEFKSALARYVSDVLIRKWS